MVSNNKDVMCRRWNWRNGHNTRITEDTKVIVMNIDGLGEDSEARAIATRDRVAQMLAEFCQADVATILLSPSKPSRCIDSWLSRQVIESFKDDPFSFPWIDPPAVRQAREYPSKFDMLLSIFYNTFW
jgi:hypothetical protein